MKTLGFAGWALAAALSAAACATGQMDEGASGEETLDGDPPVGDDAPYDGEVMGLAQALLLGCPEAVLAPITAPGTNFYSTQHEYTWNLDGVTSGFGLWWCFYGSPPLSGIVLEGSSPSNALDCGADGLNQFYCTTFKDCVGNSCWPIGQTNVMCPQNVQAGTPVGYVKNGQTVWGWPSTTHAAAALNISFSSWQNYIQGGTPSPVRGATHNGHLMCEYVASLDSAYLVLAPP